MKKHLALMLCIGLAACATVGRELSDEDIQSIKPGATQQEVVTKLGAPSQRTVMTTGETILTYTWAHSQVRAATFIPIVGLFAGGQDTQSKVIMFHFSKDGLLTDTSSSNSTIPVSIH
jgi:outer membrane protein assembly factor BamE (lipoprotein component of BamABCDE complex)